MRLSVILSMVGALLLVLTVNGCNRSSGQQGANQGGAPPSFADAQSAAANGLETFRQLVSSANFKELGFDSQDEVASASLGSPNQVYSVSLEQLKSFEPNRDANGLLADAMRVIYPVTVRGQARASITVEQRGGKWSASGFGDPKLARQINQATTALASQRQEGAPIVVHVLPFNLYFLGHRTENRLMLTPLGDYTNYNLKSGAALSASDVFANLAQIARKYNGLPM